MSSGVNELTNDIDRNAALIQHQFTDTEDLSTKKMLVHNQICLILYLNTLVKTDLIHTGLIEPLVVNNLDLDDDTVSSAVVNRTTDLALIVDALLDGSCILLSDNDPKATLICVAENLSRSIEEPKEEQTVIGPHEGFIESVDTNIYLIRKRLRSTKLKVKYQQIGKITSSNIAMLYMDGLINPDIVAECTQRLAAFETDHLYSIENIEEWIEEHPLSPFAQSLKTERPDRVISYLMEGKLCIIVDGSPNVLVVPINFFSFYQSPDDFSSRWVSGTFFRLIRLLSFIFAITLPAIYIAIVSFHAEVLPLGIFYSIKVSLTYVPFPPILEALVMQITLEILKEASIRLPSPISQTIGIVGGLVIGTAVVEAHLVSNTMIVVIGLTAIASFVTPLSEFGTSLRILGFPMIIAASLFGFFGIVLMLMVIVMHLCKLETFGEPYFYPFTNYRPKRIRDSLLRLPEWKRHSKPGFESGHMSFFKRWKKS
ncbi:spore germination protein [Paenibacillus sp. 2TAB19]|uniref:spore germination protein n=1 Tax=Paenibacillus sp. 2TAB19 TaxID=3233003 RepID=UPI003F956CC5